MTTPKNIISLEQLRGKTPLARSKVYLGDADLAGHIIQQENNEPLVSSNLLQQKGLLVRPFWIDEPDDLEGKAYATYLKTHPSFSLSVRKSVAERLQQAQQTLPKEWQIILKAGLRPLEVQYQLFDDVRTYLGQKYSDWSAAAVQTETRKLVSDPRIKVPPHATGAAVDIEVLDRTTGKLIDMGARANTDGPTGWSHTSAISAIQQKRRLALLKAMLAAGFANHAYEWWHYSYGDAMWAIFYDKPATLYDVCRASS